MKGGQISPTKLRELAHKGYPDLEEKAKEHLALNVFLSRIDNPQVAFSVKQKRPASLDEAVSATLEMECYANTEARSIAVVNAEVSKERAVAGVGAEKDVHGMKEAIIQLTERMKMLEEQLKGKEQRQGRGQARWTRSPPRCWTCGRLGHTARFCDNTHQDQGNEKPSTA